MVTIIKGHLFYFKCIHFGLLLKPSAWVSINTFTSCLWLAKTWSTFTTQVIVLLPTDQSRCKASLREVASSVLTVNPSLLRVHGLEIHWLEMSLKWSFKHCHAKSPYLDQHQMRLKLKGCSSNFDLV